MNSIIKSNFFSLGALLALSFTLISITNHYILTINFFNNSEEYLAGIPSREDEVYNSLHKYIYLSSGLYTVIKVCMVALILYTALFLADKQVKYHQALHVAIVAEFIFLIPALLKIIWFIHRYPNGTLSDWHKVYILSALSLVGDASVDWYYSLQTLNVFEVAYWFFLAYGISKISNLNFDQSLKLVAVSYLPTLFIWVITITFCTVMLFPDNA